jgi:hypothetical protein
MSSFRTFLYALAVAALAACGGGSVAGLPPAASDLGTRAPSGSTIVFEKRTLWVAYANQVNAFSTGGSGAVTPQQTLGSLPWYDSSGVPIPGSPGIVDVAVAPDGTRWVLENRDAFLGGPGWRLYAVAPGDTQPENTYGDDVNRPFALALGGDGPSVAYRSSDGTTTIATYAYAASNSAPVRTLHLTGQVLGYAAGNDGHFYVARPNAFDVYRPIPNGWALVRSIPTTTPSGSVTISSQEFAVGPDASLYVVDLPGSSSNPVMYVNVYPRGSGTVARRIGPLPANYNGLGFPVIAVDAANRLYVATNGQIHRFGPRANGAAQPQLVMTDSTPARPVALAVGPKL